ncbi:MAG: glucan biosynthesis protein D [Salinisphaera sp.]|nr:glucan biosynthesis protein D [Salinisphaera sp.]|tara:strand:+ start:3206 stop:4864 length:1659 start_codon:yes stop_codon:yes gene_type:complete
MGLDTLRRLPATRIGVVSGALLLGIGLSSAAWAEQKSSSKSQATSQKAASDKASNDKTSKGGDNPYQQVTDYAALTELARGRAAKSYKAPPGVPESLEKISASDFGKISTKSDQALWADQKSGYQGLFYPPGSFYEHTVKIYTVDGKTVAPVTFDKNDFNYPSPAVAKQVPKDAGFAGFKLTYPLNDRDKQDELISFLGASYFRALAADTHYGLSARGLAIDTADMQNGEEFPNFTRFWLVKPKPAAKTITIMALLDSPSVTGAYKFTVTPGEATKTEVEATLFTRKAIDKLGVAPLTSMFTWGENSLSRLDDYRPEAHDSDGMLISSANGEWLWRPLVNPTKLALNQFDANDVRGFGLVQRDRDFANYQDLDYHYEQRPNAWVAPKGDWGKGHLELVEIPSDSEVNDNIDLYWVPAEPVKAGKRLHFAYDITWSDAEIAPKSLGHVAASRIGRAAVMPGQQKNQVKVAIDFVGASLNKLDDPNSVKARVNAGRDVTLNNIRARRNPHTGGWRLSFLVPTQALGSPLNLRAYLADANGGGLTETWNYQLANP